MLIGEKFCILGCVGLFVIVLFVRNGRMIFVIMMERKSYVMVFILENCCFEIFVFI